jgi:N-acetylmuramoyl-L-alanine amidase
LANSNGDVFLSIHVNSSEDPRARGQEIYFQNQLPSDQESLFLASRESEKNQGGGPVIHSVSLALKNHKGLNSDVHAIVEDLERNHQFKLSGIFTEHLYQNWSGEKLQRRHSIRQAPFFVVSNIDKPAALIEIGYLSNSQDVKKLTDPQYQKKIAQGIYKALVSFKTIIDKDVSHKELVDKSTQKSLN